MAIALVCLLDTDDTCQEAVKQLTEKVTKYTECSSQYALNAGMCEQCVEYYLNAANQLATNFSVCMPSTVLLGRCDDCHSVGINRLSILDTEESVDRVGKVKSSR